MDFRHGRDPRPAHDTATVAALPGGVRRPDAANAFHQRFRDVTVAFSRGFSPTTSLASALATLTREVCPLLGARRIAVWLHDRERRELILAADSDAGEPPSAVRVRNDHPDALPAHAMRLDRPLAVGGGPDVLLLPLRGWRRALGAAVAEGPFPEELDEQQLLELAQDVGRHLASTIETVQLVEEIVRGRRLLEDTFDSLPELVFVTDAALRIVQTNEAAVARTGLSRAELLGRAVDEIIGPEMAAWIVTASISGDAGCERAGTRRFDDARLEGTFAVTVTPLPGQDATPSGHVIVARDITREAQLERERELLRERLAQSEKLAALGQFVAGVAHEMNNPLQGVLGHLELLMQTSEAAQPLRPELRRVFHEAARAAKIVRNLMLFTGVRTFNRRPLTVSRLLARVIASRGASLRRAGITVAREDGAELPRVGGDSALLHQVLLNVFANAEQAIQAAGGAREIAVSATHDPPAGRVLLKIRDSGPGIPAEILPRIFEPFFTTKDVGEGTGLGLALAYGIMQEHGGAIHAANAPGGGAVFTLELPVWHDAAEDGGR